MNDQPDAPRLPDTSAASVEIERLSSECRAAPEEIEPQVRLWKAIAALEQWFFINRGADDNPRPYAIAAEAGIMVCIYSSPERASEAALGAGLTSGDEPMSLVRVPMPAALDWVVALGERGVVGVTIDHPRVGAWTPVANLPRLRQDPTSSS